jgi:hypothetical protein
MYLDQIHYNFDQSNSKHNYLKDYFSITAVLYDSIVVLMSVFNCYSIFTIQMNGPIIIYTMGLTNL